MKHTVIDKCLFKFSVQVKEVGQKRSLAADREKAGRNAAGGRRTGSGGAADGAAATFFAVPARAWSVCFICDNSNSYRNGSFHAVLDELLRAVDRSRPEAVAFVIFSSDAAYPLFHPANADALQPATVETSRSCGHGWERRDVQRGPGHPRCRAIQRPAQCSGPIVSTLLSDGELGANHRDPARGGRFRRCGRAHLWRAAACDRPANGTVDPDPVPSSNWAVIRTGSPSPPRTAAPSTSVTVPAAAAAPQRLQPSHRPCCVGREAVWVAALATARFTSPRAAVLSSSGPRPAFFSPASSASESAVAPGKARAVCGNR